MGLYSREILSGLTAAHPETQFEFFYRAHRYLRARHLALPGNARRRLLAEPIGPRSADLFHGLNQRLPHMKLRRSVATFHDLFVLTGDYSTDEFRARFSAQAKVAAERADRIIAVSEFTRQQVISLLGVQPGKVRVVHHGIRQLPYAGGAVRENVILTVGAIQRRKNIERLVEAFERSGGDWRLVIVGSAGFGAEAILARIERSPARERITITGYITPEQLAGWYARSAIFAFPSLDEGFGMPVLEAMAAGLPVLTSNRSALPEVAGDAAILADPQDTLALAEALRNLIQKPDLRGELALRGLARARQFTWKNAVRETWDVYREAMG